jgi:HK97 family phage prohead protease
MRRVMDYLSLAEPLELAAAEDGKRTFRGYAAVFGVPSEDFGGFRYVIEPAAFDKSLRDKRDVRMFLNHDDNIVLASTRAGTLRLSTDQKGLLATADLPDNEWGRPVADGIDRGDIHTMSIGFRTISEHPSEDGKLVTKTEMRLFEVSPITSWAAFPQTTASVFALNELASHLAADADVLDDAIEKLVRGVRLTSDDADLVMRAALELYAEWDAAYVNDLPDSAFAVVLPGGTKDDAGKTVPRDLRKLPHHDAAGALDMPHLRNAMTREPQADMSAAEHAQAHAHLMRHADAQGMAADPAIAHRHHLALGELRARLNAGS